MSKTIYERRVYKSKGWTYRLDDEDKTAWVEKGRIRRCKKFRLPDFLFIDGEKYTIESVEMYAFGSQKALRHLIIPDSYNYIDEDAFYDFPQLRTVFIGKNVQGLNTFHFCRCDKLHRLNISKENPFMRTEGKMILSKDGTRLMKIVDKLHHVSIPEGVEIIDDTVLWCNQNLKSVSFPSSTRTIGDEQFDDCFNLETVIIPEGVKRIGNQCFYGCEKLSHVDLPSTLEHMGCEPFFDCINLKHLLIRTPKVFRCKSFEFRFSVPSECKIYVPDNLVQEYTKDDFWSKFNINSLGRSEDSLFLNKAVIYLLTP